MKNTVSRHETSCQLFLTSDSWWPTKKSAAFALKAEIKPLARHLLNGLYRAVRRD
jgi:hypothetical protein